MSNRNRARKRRTVPQAAVTAAPAAQRPAKQAQPAAKPKPAPRRPVTTEAVPGLERAALIAAGCAALLAFLVYALTVEPSVPTGDSGELISAAYVFGVAHPPGYPLYMLLGYLVSHLPGGSPALWMNQLSAFLDALAVGVVFLTIHRLVSLRAGTASRRWTPFVAAAVGALLLAFSSLFWAYSVVAEVFALNNLFAAALLLIGIEWCRQPQRTRLLWLFMLVLGLALCNQQTILLLVPAFVVLAWQGWVLLPRAGGRLRISLRDLGIAVGAFVVGLLPYLYLPAAASGNPVMDWGNPTSAGRFFTQVTRGNYGSTSLVAGGKPGSIWENLKLLSTSLAHGFVYAGVILAVAGLWWAWRNRRAEGIALFVAFLFAGPIFQAYTNTSYPDDLTKGVVARFYILPSIPLAILSGLGAWWVLGLAERVSLSRRALVTGLAAAALLVVPVASAAAHYSSEDQSGNRVASNYATDILGQLPPNALLLMRGDENYTSLSYAQFVEHQRPDVVALDTELLKLPEYVQQIHREHPDILIPFASYDGGVHTSLNTLISANLPNRPVFSIGSQTEKAFGKPFAQQTFGLMIQMLPKGAGSSNKYAAIQADPTRFANLHYPAKTYPASTWEGGAIEPDYGNAAFDVGYGLDVENRTDPDLIEHMYRTAIRLFPTSSSPYKNLGLFLYDRGGDPKEVISLWTRFLKLDPSDPQAGSIRTVLAQLQAKQSKP
jgi:4-amino-4-deoxy-L-arabinose transferase-like glycosyltransferase